MGRPFSPPQRSSACGVTPREQLVNADKGLQMPREGSQSPQNEVGQRIKTKRITKVFKK